MFLRGRVSNNLDNPQFFFRERVVFPTSFKKFKLVRGLVKN